jgi:polyhydroxyalkanoate synthesis regulator phasin
MARFYDSKISRKTMIDLLKQAILSTIGLASLTKQKAQELAVEIARLGNLSQEEMLKLQNDLVERGEAAQHALAAEIDRRVDSAFIQTGLLKASVKQEGESAVSALRSTADTGVDEILSRLRVARLEDIEALAGRLDLLEKKLASK